MLPMLKAVVVGAVAAHFGVRRLDRAGRAGQTIHLEATAVAPELCRYLSLQRHPPPNSP